MKDSARIPIIVALFVLFVLALGLSRSSCGPEVVTIAADAAASAAPIDGTTVKEAGAELPARCSRTTAEAALEGGDSFEVGGAELSASEITVAASLSRDGGREGVVFQADLALSKIRATDLGELAGGDLVPRLATCSSCNGRVVVASYAVSAAGPKSFGNVAGTARPAAQRTLVVSALDGGKATPLVRLPQQADESAAFDLVLADKDSGLVAWDEDSDRVVRGIVKVAPFGGGKPGEPVVVSPYETDADSPKLVRNAKGEVFVGWIAREVIGTDGGVADADLQGAYLEAPGEERAHQWIEIVALDTTGKPRGAPFAVTARGRGFASSFELVGTPDGVDVLVVDGAVRQDGMGSRVLRVPVRAGKPGAALELVSAGGGAASATVFGAFVTFVDVSERSMVVALDPPHTVSREPLARGGRFVAAVGSTFYSVGVDGADGGVLTARLRRHDCP
jgi:hypothetical protein